MLYKSELGGLHLKKYNEKFLQNHLKRIIDIKPGKFDSINEDYYTLIPHIFYKFRNCNENNFIALENQYVWLTTADQYDGDLMDSTILYDTYSQRNRIMEVIKHHMPDIISKELIPKLAKIGIDVSSISTESIKEFITGINYNNGGLNFAEIQRKLISKGIKYNQIKEIQTLIKKRLEDSYFENIAKKFVNKMNSLNKRIQKNYYISSFTKTYKNKMLWEFYAGKRTGFCIEYDLSLMEKIGLNKYKFLFALTPMIYNQRKEVDISKTIDVAILEYLNKGDMKKKIEVAIELETQIRNKDSDYDKEKEWRLMINKKFIKDQKHSFPFATAIYTGLNIENENFLRLKDIAKKLGIKLYKEQFNQTKSEYTFEIVYNPQK